MTSTHSTHVPLHRCRDYVRISSGSFGSQEACGQDMSVDFNTYLQSKIMYIVLSFGMQALLLYFANGGSDMHFWYVNGDTSFHHVIVPQFPWPSSSLV